jgi:hypothetical protein
MECRWDGASLETSLETPRCRWDGASLETDLERVNGTNGGLLFSLETHYELLTASTAYQGKFRSDSGSLYFKVL